MCLTRESKSDRWTMNVDPSGVPKMNNAHQGTTRCLPLKVEKKELEVGGRLWPQPQMCTAWRDLPLRPRWQMGRIKRGEHLRGGNVPHPEGTPTQLGIGIPSAGGHPPPSEGRPYQASRPRLRSDRRWPSPALRNQPAKGSEEIGDERHLASSAPVRHDGGGCGPSPCGGCEWRCFRHQIR